MAARRTGPGVGTSDLRSRDSYPRRDAIGTDPYVGRDATGADPYARRDASGMDTYDGREATSATDSLLNGVDQYAANLRSLLHRHVRTTRPRYCSEDRAFQAPISSTGGRAPSDGKLHDPYAD